MYPIAYEADFNPEPNRWTTFFRLILAIPWLIVAYVYLLVVVFTHIFAWVAVVILGRYPQWLYDFNAGVVRYLVRFYAWAYLQTDVWPPSVSPTTTPTRSGSRSLRRRRSRAG